MDKLKTASFSGYRLEKLPDSDAEDANNIKNLKLKLHDAIVESIERGFDAFLVGMVEVFDMYATENIIKIKKIIIYRRSILLCPLKHRASYHTSCGVSRFF